jgi:hypothetical protein
MTIFAQYYNEKKELTCISMSEMKDLITDKSQKKEIAKHIYERLYTRFLKIFDYNNSKTVDYLKNKEIETKNEFQEEFKNGFLQMASCSLLIETLSAFLTGENQTPNGQSSNRFNKVFDYANTHNNDLKEFKNGDFYKKIRCGILHQGETKGKYTITRKGLDLKKGNKIDAFLFHRSLKELLQTYRSDLENLEWDDEIWDSCRQKIRFIIKNGE